MRQRDYSNVELWSLIFRQIQDLRQRLNQLYALLRKLEGRIQTK